MAIEALVWDVNNGFGNEDLARPLMAAVVEAAPDVAVFPRAFGPNVSTDRLDAMKDSLANAHPNYIWNSVAYEAEQPTNLLMLTRDDLLLESTAIYTADRQALKQTVLDPAAKKPVAFIGLDLDAMTEVARQEQIHDLLAHVSAPYTLVGGNFHAMMRFRPTRNMYSTPRHVRFAAMYARLAHDRHHRTGSTGLRAKLEKYRRLGEAASGKTMARLIDAGFFDADAHQAPTEPAINPEIQTTHIMLKRGQFFVNQFSTLHEPQTLALSPENRAIRATISMHETRPIRRQSGA